jgi:hypothetical protein
MKITFKNYKKHLDEFTYMADGKEYAVNPYFAIQRKASYKTLEKVKSIHVQLCDLVKKVDEEDDAVKLNKLVDEITELDYQLQDLWGFERDKNFHTWLKKSKRFHCTCPILDNEDMPKDMRFISEDCPLHGKKL